MTVTGPAADHARLGELAAGYALHALEPQEEAEFLRHLPDCAECQDALAGFTEVTAALADSWPESAPAEPDQRPDPRLGERIMAAIAEGRRRARRGPGRARVRRTSRELWPAWPSTGTGAGCGQLSRPRRPRRW